MAGRYRPILEGSVIFERSWKEALSEELTRAGAERMFVVDGTSFARKSEVEKHYKRCWVYAWRDSRRAFVITRRARTIIAVAARRDSLIGAWLGTMGLRSNVPMGASHAIGHAFGGTAGVPHGITSCLMLAHVLRWNRTVNSDRQQIISAAFGDAPASAGDQVAAWVGLLGLPSRLRDVGIAREELTRIAAVAFLDPWTHSNPRPVDSSRSILALLEAAW